MTRSFLERTAFKLGSATGGAIRMVSSLIPRWFRRGEAEQRRALSRRPLSARSGPAPSSGSTPWPAHLDPDPEVRCRAARRAAELDGPEAEQTLLELLHDSDSEVRAAAASGAARARASSAVFSLILALEDPAPRVAEAAERSLRQLTGRELHLASRGPERLAQIEELKRWWKEQRLAALTGTLAERTEP